MFENRQFKSGEDYYHRLNFLFNLLIALPLVPFGILYLARLKASLPVIKLNDQLILILDGALTAIVAIIIFKAYTSYKKEKVALQMEDNLRQKMIRFHEILISKYVLLSAACGLLTIGLFITRHDIHVVTFMVVLVLLSLARPTLKLIVEELRLSPSDADILRNRDDIPH